ncbi:MAG TPA: hypothetical protein VNO50_08615 [Pyrinomonadaceae bacterium]|nr:hypothetical protein [Pyrinomonadaceae bacterium]
MLSLPINATTFKKTFFDGNGNLEISTDQDTWKSIYDSGQPFTKDNQKLAQIKLGMAATKPFQFGQPGTNGLKLSLGISGEANGSVKLIWPGATDPLIDAYQLNEFLTPGRLYAAIILSAKADASVKGSTTLFSGPLKADFGVGAGANAGYDRLVLFDATRPAREVLGELFGGVRLPQAVDPGDVLAPGEILAFRYGGYLNLSASVAWGYSFTGTRDYKALDLNLAIDYAVRLAASASFDYRLAGEFSIERRRGKDANSAHIVVRKGRESSTQFAADFGFEAEANLSGLPDSPDKLLSALLGTDAKSILQVLATVEENSTLEGLEKSVGKLAKKFIYDRAGEWIGKALDETTVKEFLAAVHQVVTEYQGIDDRIIHLYEDFLDNKVPGLEASLNLLLGVGTQQDLQRITDGDTWDLIRRLWNEKFNDLLLKETEFEQFSEFVKKVKEFLDGGVAKNVRDFIASVKKEFPLDGLLNQLAKYDTPDELKALADEKLQAFVGRIIGRTFAELSGNADFQRALKQIQAVRDKIDQFRKTYAKAVKLAAHQSVAFHLNYLYKRASKGESLLDVEIDISTTEGARLAELALSGDFTGVLKGYNPQLVRINKGKFTHEVTRSAQVNISIFNWNYKGIVELVQNSQHSVETVERGLLHVYSIDTSISQTTEKDWKKLKEAVRSNFLLSIVGQSPQPAGSPDSAIGPENEYLIETIRSVTAKYDLLFEDDRTKAAELTQYLQLAEYLRLIPSAPQTVNDIEVQFPQGLGKVSVKYVVNYDDAAVRNGLIGPGSEDLSRFARLTARGLVAAKYTGMRDNDWLAPMGFAFLDQGLYDAFHNIGNPEAFAQKTVTVSLPDWFVAGGKKVVLRKSDLWVLAKFYKVEDKFVERLMKLRGLVKLAPGARIPEEDLRDAARHFVDMADDLDEEGGTNTFFAVFDQLAQRGQSAGGTRKSAVVIEITPPGANAKKVTKYLMA